MHMVHHYTSGTGYTSGLVAESAGDAILVLRPIADVLHEKWKFAELAPPEQSDSKAKSLFEECEAAIQEIEQIKERAKEMNETELKDAIFRISDLRTRFVYNLNK